MGCHVCGRRPADPVSGPSTWRRAVVAGEQVLVCPDCQVDGWTDTLDACGACGSTMLVKRLGEVTCRSCGAVGEVGQLGEVVPAPATSDPPTGTRAARELLAEDVAAALGRMLRGDA